MWLRHKCSTVPQTVGKQIQTGSALSTFPPLSTVHCFDPDSEPDVCLIKTSSEAKTLHNFLPVILMHKHTLLSTHSLRTRIKTNRHDVWCVFHWSVTDTTRACVCAFFENHVLHAQVHEFVFCWLFFKPRNLWIQICAYVRICMFRA